MTDANDAFADNQTVFVTNDDPTIRYAMGELLESVGHQCAVFGPADEFLAKSILQGPAA